VYRGNYVPTTLLVAERFQVSDLFANEETCIRKVLPFEFHPALTQQYVTKAGVLPRELRLKFKVVAAHHEIDLAVTIDLRTYDCLSHVDGTHQRIIHNLRREKFLDCTCGVIRSLKVLFLKSRHLGCDLPSHVDRVITVALMDCGDLLYGSVFIKVIDP